MSKRVLAVVLILSASAACRAGAADPDVLTTGQLLDACRSVDPEGVPSPRCVIYFRGLIDGAARVGAEAAGGPLGRCVEAAGERVALVVDLFVDRVRNAGDALDQPAGGRAWDAVRAYCELPPGPPAGP